MQSQARTIGWTPPEPGGERQRIEEVEVTLVGAGRSGSAVAPVLAMLGARLRLYDPDRLGPENQGLQLYNKQDVEVGRLKVEALASAVNAIVPGARLATHAEAFEGRFSQPHSPVVVLAVDRMDTRRRLWEAMRDSGALTLWMDVRLGRGLVRLHVVHPSSDTDRSAYEASLHDDVSALARECLDEGTSHAAAAAAALVGGALRAFVDDLPFPQWVALNLDRGIWSAGPRSLGG